jgi:hypothetical protein
MTGRVVQFTGLMLVALVTGVFWGTWFTLTRSLETFGPGEFLHIGQTIIANVAVPMRILMPAFARCYALEYLALPGERLDGILSSAGQLRSDDRDAAHYGAGGSPHRQ